MPSHLYTDENPATTIKGTGFKDREMAIQTIKLTSQEGVRYKQKWTILAMRERAAHHPHQTPGMREAMEVFDAWLRDYIEPDAATVQQELQAHRRLCSMRANQNAYQPGSSDEERQHIQAARKDEQRGRKLLLEAVQKERVTVPLDLTAFTAVFGGPGLHGYGEHRLCGEEHVVDVFPAAQVEALLQVPKRPPLVVPERLTIVYTETPGANAALSVAPGKGMQRIEDMWHCSRLKKRPRDPDDAEVSGTGQGAQQGKAHGLSIASMGWTCGVCTFEHQGRMAGYLTCHMCASERQCHE